MKTKKNMNKKKKKKGMCKTWHFHSDEDSSCGLVGCNAVYLCSRI